MTDDSRFIGKMSDLTITPGPRVREPRVDTRNLHLKRAREKTGLTQQQVAERADLSRAQVWRIEQNENARISTLRPSGRSASSVVIGNCKGGTDVNAVDVKTAPNQPGAASEGKTWAAVSLPTSAGFDGCGWINALKLRSTSSSPAATSCNAPPGPDYNESSHIKRYKTRLAGSPRPNTQKYRGLYVWKRKIVRNEVRDGQQVRVEYEGDGKKYVPTFRDSDVSCTAYANINPYKGGQQAAFAERLWTVHDRSPNLRIRYVAKFRGDNENGQGRWWVMARSMSDSDDDRSWGFLSAECLFTF